RPLHATFPERRDRATYADAADVPARPGTRRYCAAARSPACGPSLRNPPEASDAVSMEHAGQAAAPRRSAAGWVAAGSYLSRHKTRRGMTYSVHLYLVPLPVTPNTQLTPPTVAVPAAVAVRWCPSDV